VPPKSGVPPDAGLLLFQTSTSLGAIVVSVTVVPLGKLTPEGMYRKTERR
jgi:hypothetical protein